MVLGFVSAGYTAWGVKVPYYSPMELGSMNDLAKSWRVSG